LENGIIFSLKLKRKTQNSREKLKTQGKNSMSRRTCPLPPSQVMLKKSLTYMLIFTKLRSNKAHFKWMFVIVLTSTGLFFGRFSGKCRVVDLPEI